MRLETNLFISARTRFTTAITLEMTYGHKVKTDDDRHLQIADQVNVVLTKMTNTPILELFPNRECHITVPY